MAYDGLTGLPLRRDLERALAVDGGRYRSVAVLDCDRTKLLNDARGHVAGDEALVDLARRLAEILPGRSTAYRVGGDEFALLADAEPEDLALALQDLQPPAAVPSSSALEAPARLGFSAGVVAVREPVDVDRLLRDCDATMFFAKSLGGGRVEVHGPGVEGYAAYRRDVLARNVSLHAELRRLREMVRTDHLTGIGNRRALDEQLARAERRRSTTTWAVLFIDVDHFHDYNRRNGDSAGDDALRQIARCLDTALRAGDVLTTIPRAEIFRRGGEEFAVIAGVADDDAAVALARRLLRAVEDLRIPLGIHGRPFVTVSIGVALTPPESDVTGALDVAGRRAYWLKANHRRGEVRATDD